MTNDYLHTLFEDIIKDLASAEQMIMEKGLPAMIKAAENAELKKAFELHLDQTKGHLTRLEELAGTLDITLSGKKCLGMEGIIAEGEEMISMDLTGNARDFALLSAAQKVEHYEMASYSSAIMLAELMEHDDALDLLEATLDEEVETSQKLDEVVENLLMDMEETDDADDEDVEE